VLKAKSYLQERITTSHHNTAIQCRPNIHITHAHTGRHNVTYSKHSVAHQSTSHLNHTGIKECLRDTETLAAKVLHNIANYKIKYFNKRKPSEAGIQTILPKTNTDICDQHTLIESKCEELRMIILVKAHM
jgi:hypothetical protein